MNRRIDFTSEDILPDGSDFGRVGENNATILIIKPPSEITDNEKISVVCVACEVGDGFIKNVVRSEMFEKAETITVPLWSQATVSEEGKLQVEGYDGEENLLIKSELITYTLSPSAKGEPQRYEADAEINKSIAANTSARHSHNNTETLNKLGESGGQLTYNGSAVGGRPFATYTIDDSSVSDLFGITTLAIVTYREDETLPKITDIKTIRIKYDGEWVDIHKMTAIDDIPYTLNLCGHYSEMIGGYVLAMVSFDEGSSNTIMGYGYALDGFESIEIDYYTEGDTING